MYGFQNYLEKEGYKEKTITTYLATLNWFFSFINSKYKRHIELYEIQPSDIKEFLKSKEESGNSKHSINKCISVLKSFFDYLWNEGKIPVDPAVKIKRLKIDQANSIDLSYNQLLELKPSILRDNRYNLITKCIFILALKGLRFSEFHFKKENVVIKNNKIEISIYIRNKIRIVVLVEDDAEIFEQFYYDCLFNEGEYVFTTKRHRSNVYAPIEIDSLYSYLKNIKLDYNLPKRFKLDDIRIAYAHYLRVKKKYVVDEIAEELGIEKFRAAELCNFAIERYSA